MTQNNKDRSGLVVYGGIALFLILFITALFFAQRYEDGKSLEYKQKVEECRNSGQVWTGYEYNETSEEYNPAECMTSRQAKFEECESKASRANDETLDGGFSCTPEGELKGHPQ